LKKGFHARDLKIYRTINHGNENTKENHGGIASRQGFSAFGRIRMMPGWKWQGNQGLADSKLPQLPHNQETPMIEKIKPIILDFIQGVRINACN